MTCERCGSTQISVYTMSYFNTEMICMACQRKERGHPMYQEAVSAENAAVALGDLNYAGIGLPEDLREQLC